MRKNGLRPRAIGALSVVAGSLFLLLCLANYGQGGFEAADSVPWHIGLAGWFVEVFGAGAFALVLLPLVWGLVVYFREDTPSLSMRAAGTLLLACSISMVSGLVQGGTELAWAGAVGEYTVALTGGLGGVLGDGFAMALAWAAAVTLFMASLVWATDWWFHSLRKGPVVPTLPSRPRVETEPLAVELRDDESPEPAAEAEEREVIPMATAGAGAVESLHTEPVDEDEPQPVVAQVPEGFSTRHTGGRMVVRGPVGYQGVEFLPPSDELAPPAEPEQRIVSDVEVVVGPVLDDELRLDLGTDEIDAADDGSGLVLDAGDLAEDEPDAARIATVEETLGTPAAFDEAELVDELDDLATGPEAEAAVLASLAEENGESLPSPEAVVVDEPLVDRPRSGIGLPDDSPFVDEFFAVDVLVADAFGAGDGASADGEVEAAFGTPIPAVESPESTFQEEAPAPRPEPASETAPEAVVARRAAPVIVDELLFADAYDVVDEEIPAPVAARSAPPARPAEPEVDDTASTGLERLHDMQLDPLFHDAVEVVLEAGRGTAMSLQRRFGIGHGRGLRLLEQMQEAGILAPEDASGSREVCIARADWEAFTGSNAS